MHPLILLLIVGVAGWLLYHFVSPLLAALVVLVVVVYVLIQLFHGSRL